MRRAHGWAISLTSGIVMVLLMVPGAASARPGLHVFVGYADTLRANPTHFPTPWAGAPKTVFIGGGTLFDAGAVRIVNGGREAVHVSNVRIDLHHGAHGASDPVFDLWGRFTIPAHGEAILTQTLGRPTKYDFDTSDFPFEPPAVPAPLSDPRIPTVTVTIQQVSFTFRDTGHVLDTRGNDVNLTFKRTVNESTQWTSIGRAPCVAARLTLGPHHQANQVGRTAIVTATLTNSCGEPLTNVRIRCTILSGPHRGELRSGVTDSSGKVRFRYVSSLRGTSELRASVSNPAGHFNSASVAVTWGQPLGGGHPAR
jgi:hypothetical protein